MEQTLLFLVIGPAGVGKSTVIQRLLSLQNTENNTSKNKPNIRFLPSYTTRSQRGNETKGHPYFFVDQTEFERKIQQGELLEWKLVHGNQYYGIGKQELESILRSSDHGITDMEVLGAREMAEKFPARCISIFLSAEENELIERMQTRNNRSEEIQRRLYRAKLELLYQNDFDYFIPNENLELACQQISEIINFESKFFSKRRGKYNFLKIFVVCESQVLLRIKKRIQRNLPHGHHESTKAEYSELFFCRFRPDYSWQNALFREFSLLFSNLSLDECKSFIAPTPIFLDSSMILANISQNAMNRLKKLESENFFWQSFPIEKAKQMVSMESDISALSKMTSLISL